MVAVMNARIAQNGKVATQASKIRTSDGVESVAAPLIHAITVGVVSACGQKPYVSQDDVNLKWPGQVLMARITAMLTTPNSMHGFKCGISASAVALEP